MRKIDIALLRAVFNAVNQTPGLSFSQLKETYGIGKSTLSRYFARARACGLNNAEVCALSEGEFMGVMRLGNRKVTDLIEPDMKAILEYMRPRRTFGRRQMPSRASAWFNAYFKIHFPEQADAVLDINNYTSPGSRLPEGCMSYPTFCRRLRRELDFMAEIRNISSTMSMSCGPGGQMQIDGVGNALVVRRSDNSIVSFRVFCAVLPFSGMVFFYAGTTATREDWLRFIIEAHYYFGGSAASVKADNDTAITTPALKCVLKKDGRRIYTRVPCAEFRAISEQFSTIPVLTGRSAPRQKAIVEWTAGAVQTLEFPNVSPQGELLADSLEEVNSILRKASDRFNLQYFKDQQYSRRSLFEQYEKDCLTPLPIVKPEVLHIRTVTVRPSGYVRFLNNEYFIGEGYRGQSMICQVTEYGTRLSIRSVATLRVIDTYTLATGFSPRVQRFKHDKYYSKGEQYLSHDEQYFIDLLATLPIDAELSAMVIKSIWTQDKMSVADRNRCCYNLFNFCSSRSDRAPELERAMAVALHQGKGADIWLIQSYADGIGAFRESTSELSAEQSAEERRLIMEARERSDQSMGAGADIAAQLQRQISATLNGGAENE